MNANMINNAEILINDINSTKNVKVVKKDKGLLEKKNSEETIIITEDNRRVLLG